MRSLLFLIPLILVAGPAAAAPRHILATPRDGGAGFSIAIPPGLVRQDVRGIDSEVSAFEGEGIALSFDYGWYSAILSCEAVKESCAERRETVGGRTAHVVEAQWPFDEGRGHRRYVGLLFELGGPVRLSASATCVDERACARALDVLRTIAFEGGEPPPAATPETPRW
ncbi:hypothetical protein E2493_18380 [Sphingomonas parva]|uniref:DUF3558 domain-containing protein n=1 Tax=Sphingomonas parva TaxID=2555898 RepID=A0A4Y8ZPN1_9SPHN|nr:hypothetical protein [Sphingomonas parva]TFI56799.1 hypothetical protein E2493_18380 [Sphingomonas parva]